MLSRAEGKTVIDHVQKADLLVGRVPDTFMGAGHQTCGKLIDDGWIGTPVAAIAFMMCHGQGSILPSPYLQGIIFKDPVNMNAHSRTIP